MRLLLKSSLAATLTLFFASATFAQVIKPGVWRATLQTTAGVLPFGLDVQPGPNNTFAVYVLNGNERLKFDDATLEGDSLRIPMAIFDSELKLKVSDKTMTGVWRRQRGRSGFVDVPLRATFGATYRFAPTGPEATVNLTGNWATTFRSLDGKDTTAAVGVFQQKGHEITGTFLTPTGDYRYLAGNVFGDSLFLSCFDGTHAFLFKAKAGPNKTLTGIFQSGATYRETFTARFDPAATLPDPATLTFVKPDQKFSFAFSEPNGNVVKLDDARFKGKVTVVQLLGTWCPNCMDETNFLAPWYKKNQRRGVEVVGLAFERSAQLAESGPKIERMKQRFGVTYPVLLAGTNNKDEAAKQLPALNRVVAFPTTIFIDKKGQVRHIHTGFAGPGTGQYYDQYVAEFGRLIDKLLAE